MDSKSDLLEEADVNFYAGKQAFQFPNGDTYDGEYCAHRSGIVWREGIGTYTTHDGQIYYGEWREDKLVENKPIEVVYPSGDQYYGCLIKNKYEGPGTYIFDNKMSLLCDFVNNKPVGDISLIDIKGREWHGVAAQDDVLLYPEHIYFNNIPDHAGKGWIRGKGRSRMSDTLFDPANKISYVGGTKPGSKAMAGHHPLKQSKSLLIQAQRSKSLLLSSQISKSLLPGQKGTTMRKSKLSVAIFQNKQSSRTDVAERERLIKEEQKIFGKTKKTASDLQFQNSNWYKNYVNFKKVFEDISEKVNKDGKYSLEEDERKWYEKYLKFRERYNGIMKRRADRTKDLTQEQMFELFNSEELQNKCPPVMVVYPTEDCGSICECESINKGGL